MVFSSSRSLLGSAGVARTTKQYVQLSAANIFGSQIRLVGAGDTTEEVKS